MKTVVIGNGMVGSRFAADLVATDPRADVVVLGKEDRETYNRVLLSSVVSGSVAAPSLAMPSDPHERVSVRRGASAVHIDRQTRTVQDSLGGFHSYDRLVLATGSTARVPVIEGLPSAGRLPNGVSVLKDLCDAERIDGAVAGATRAVVLGAGVLGLEVATGLAARGLRVAMVHHADRLMERQLGEAASGVTRHSLQQLGVQVMTGTSITSVGIQNDALHSVTLRDGTQMLSDLLVICAGTVPETTLAQGADLPCERGICVGADLASPADPAVFAIGDCAQPPEGGTGLVAQGWSQAQHLVETWTTTEVPESVPTDREMTSASASVTARRQGTSAPTDIVRLKAAGLEVVAMGLCGSHDGAARGLRTVQMSDPSGGRFTEIVVNGDRLVGATVVGDKVTASALSALYSRTMPVPADPAHLIIRPLSAATSSPVTQRVGDMPDTQRICQCNGVSKARIRTALTDGCLSIAEVAKATRAGTGCGDCRPLISDLIDLHDRESAARRRRPALAGTPER